MMKKLICLCLALALVICITPALTAKAGAPLDEIEEYKITVDIQGDGTMYITYHIEWKVLDSTSEGPLTWVKIGIPNERAYDIKALSSSINDIYYYGEVGDYVRIDLDRSYNAGETVTMDFSLCQPYLYVPDSAGYCFKFTPGWFEGIEVKSLIILWNSENVLDSNAPETEGNYLKWAASLSPGERYSISVNYGIDAFDASGYPADTPADPDYTPLPSEILEYIINDYSYSDPGPDAGAIFPIIIGVIAVVIRIILIINRLRGGGGGYGGGFGTGGHTGGGGHCACVSSCACACGCACACACAGGGRAGCSAKNFYGTAPRTDKLESILKQSKGRATKNSNN